ncbi:unnamed protein product [Umbelopsis vinacea]
MGIDWSLWLGAPGSGSSKIEKILTAKNGDWIDSTDQVVSHFVRTQDRTVTSMLDDGIRLLKADLCARAGEEPRICHESGNDIGYGTTFKNYLREAFRFMSEHAHQGLVLHLDDNPMDTVDIRQIERVIDDVCVEFANNTADVTSQCPWIHTKKEVSAQLPTVGELVDYDPDMSQWEGDGEDVGVRSRMIVTHSQEFARPYGYKSHYMSQPFWQSTYATSQDVSQLRMRLQKMSKKANAIEVVASRARSPVCTQGDACGEGTGVSGKEVTNLLLDALSSKQGFSMGNMSPYARIAAVSMSFYESNLAQLKEIQRELLKVNEIKLSQIKATHEESAKSRTDGAPVYRDEL